MPVTSEEWHTQAEWVDDNRTMVRWGEMILDCWWLAEMRMFIPTNRPRRQPTKPRSDIAILDGPGDKQFRHSADDNDDGCRDDYFR
jgi:hypothetical protein